MGRGRRALSVMRLHVSEAESDVTSAAPRSFTPIAFASLTSLLLGFYYFVARLRRLTPLTPGAFRRSQLVAGDDDDNRSERGRDGRAFNQRSQRGSSPARSRCPAGLRKIYARPQRCLEIKGQGGRKRNGNSGINRGDKSRADEAGFGSRL